MTDSIVQSEINAPRATIVLNDSARRNAMTIDMFDALDAVLAQLRDRDDVHVVLVKGNGPAFCAGFDLAAAVEDPSILEPFVLRLSTLARQLRRLPQVVVAAVHGAAIAGGCAFISACDFVVVEQSTKIGYPVHRIGLSPAVSAPTLMQAIGQGAARQLMMSGSLIDGAEAHQLSLASHCCDGVQATFATADELCATLAAHGAHAMRVTKHWLNTLDGSLDDQRFQHVAADTAREALEDSCVLLLREFWSMRSASARRK